MPLWVLLVPEALPCPGWLVVAQVIKGRRDGATFSKELYNGHLHSTMLAVKLIFSNNLFTSYVRTNSHCPCPQSIRVRAEGKVGGEQVH